MNEKKEKTATISPVAIVSPTKQGTPSKESYYLLIPKETREKCDITENTSFLLFATEKGDLTYKRNAS